MTTLDHVLIFLTAYLWLMGGLGWVFAMEQGTKKALTSAGKVIIVLIWPVLAIGAAYGSLRDFARAPKE